MAGLVDPVRDSVEELPSQPCTIPQMGNWGPERSRDILSITQWVNSKALLRAPISWLSPTLFMPCSLKIKLVCICGEFFMWLVGGNRGNIATPQKNYLALQDSLPGCQVNNTSIDSWKIPGKYSFKEEPSTVNQCPEWVLSYKVR